MRKHHRADRAFVLGCLMLALMMLGTAADAPPRETSQDTQQFTFVVFGDNRPNRPDLAQSDVCRKVLKEIDALDPAFAVNTGDSIYGSGDRTRLLDQWNDYNETIRSHLSAKAYLALGNHEILGSKASQEFFAKELGALYYSFDYGDSHFIVLDSEVVGQAARITGEQMEWLKADLKKARAARHKFVFLHRPLYPVDGHMGNCLDKYPKDRDALHMLFVRNRITAVFAGHEHLFDEQKRNGVRYIITGGGGAFLYPSTRGEGDFFHFVEVSVAGDKVDMKVRKLAQGGQPAEVVPAH